MNPTKTYPNGRPVPSDSPFELFAWYFMRVSGLLLVFLALGHLVIMHILNNIGNIDYEFVAQRWANPFWRLYDGLMLFLALLHGMNGLRTILDDFLRPGIWRVLAMTAIYFLTFFLMLIGFLILFTFHPVY